MEKKNFVNLKFMKSVKIMIIVRYLVIGRGLLWYKNVYSWSILFIRYICILVCIYNEYGLNSR